jgi:hypothetical protein
MQTPGSLIPQDFSEAPHEPSPDEKSPRGRSWTSLVITIALVALVAMGILGAVVYGLIRAGVTSTADLRELLGNAPPATLETILGELPYVPEAVMWSVDGSRFAAAAETTAGYDVRVLGSQFEFPSGSRLQYAVFSPTDMTRYVLSVTRPDTSGVTVIIDGVEQPDSFEQVDSISWSQSGAHIGIMGRQRGSLVIYSDGVRITPRTLGTDAYAASPLAWSPSGAHHAYMVSLTSTNEYALVVDGRVVRTLPDAQGGVLFGADGTLYAGACSYTISENGAVVSRGCLAHAILAASAGDQPVYIAPEDDRYPAKPARAAIVSGSKKLITNCPFTSASDAGCLSLPVWGPESLSGAHVETRGTSSVVYIDGALEPAVYTQVHELVLSNNGRHVAYAAEDQTSNVVVLDGMVVDEDFTTTTTTRPFAQLQFSPENIHFAYTTVRAEGQDGKKVTTLILDGAPIATADHIANIHFDEVEGKIRFNAIRDTKLIAVETLIPDRSFVIATSGRPLKRPATLAVAPTQAQAGITFSRESGLRWNITQLSTEELASHRLRFDVFSERYGRIASAEITPNVPSGTTTIFVPSLLRTTDGKWQSLTEGTYRFQATLYRTPSVEGVCAPAIGGECTYALLQEELRTIALRAVAPPLATPVTISHPPLRITSIETVGGGDALPGSDIALSWKNPGGGSLVLELIDAETCADAIRCASSFTQPGTLPNTGIAKWNIPTTFPAGTYLFRLMDTSTGVSSVADSIVSIGMESSKPVTPVPKPSPQPVPSTTSGGTTGVSTTAPPPPPPVPGTVSTPLFAPGGKDFSSPFAVTITSATPGAVIRYTTSSGSTNPVPPTESSSAYTGPISVTDSVVISAKAFKTGMTASGVSTQTYRYVPVATETVATPSITPSGGSFTGSTAVNMSVSTAGATIRYTTNGTEPSETSTAYTGAITISETTTLKARAFKTGATASSVRTVTFTKQASGSGGGSTTAPPPPPPPPPM